MSSCCPPSESDGVDIDKCACLLDAAAVGGGLFLGVVDGGGDVISDAAPPLADDHCIALGAKQEGADFMD